MPKVFQQMAQLVIAYDFSTESTIKLQNNFVQNVEKGVENNTATHSCNLNKIF